MVDSFGWGERPHLLRLEGGLRFFFRRQPDGVNGATLTPPGRRLPVKSVAVPLALKVHEA
jgi:hypothetical protein